MTFLILDLLISMFVLFFANDTSFISKYNIESLSINNQSKYINISVEVNPRLSESKSPKNVLVVNKLFNNKEIFIIIIGKSGKSSIFLVG